MQESHRKRHNSNAGPLAYFSWLALNELFLNGDQNEKKKRDPRLLEEKEGNATYVGSD
jgi:hypothetical protein